MISEKLLWHFLNFSCKNFYWEFITVNIEHFSIFIVENVTDWCKIVQDDANDEDDVDGDDDIPHYTNIDISGTPGDQQAG